MGFVLPEICTQFFCQLIQILSKKFIFFRVIADVKDPDDKLSVSLFQPMHHYMVRDRFIVDIYIGKDAFFSHFCPAVDVGNFQIAVFSDGSPAAEDAVVTGSVVVDAAAYHPAPAQDVILVHPATHQLQNLSGGAKMDKFGRCQTEEFHPVGTQYLPDTFPCFCQFRAEFTLWFFLIKIFQGGIFCKGIEEICIKGQAGLFIDMSVVIFFCFNEGIQGIHHLSAEDQGAGVNVHAVRLVDCSYFSEHFFGFFLKAAFYVAVLPIKVNPMVLSGLDIFFERNGCCTCIVVVDLQGIKEKKHIPGKEDHSFSDTGGNGTHADHKFVKKCGVASVRQFVGYR